METFSESKKTGRKDGQGNPNLSLLFMIKDDVIVQIGMADGLDGQIWTPVFTGGPAL